MTFHKKRTNKRHLRPKRHASRSRKGGFGDEETNDAGDPKFDRDIEMGVTDADVAESSPESSAESDAELMETGSTKYSKEEQGDEIKGDEMVGGKAKKSRRHSKKRKAHKTHKRRHARKHSKSHKKK